MRALAPIPSLDAIPHSVGRRIRTLGHALTRLRAGLETLRQQTSHGTLTVTLPADWLTRWAGDALTRPLPLPIDSTSALSLTWHDQAWQVVAPLVAEVGQANLQPDWLVALLLLQLPALKGFWQRALRTQRFALLRRILPRVWPVDLTPLPPGTTISGLDLTQWQDLPRLLAQGRRFQLVSLETGDLIPLDSSTSSAAWLEHLNRASTGRWVVLEQEAASPDELLWATWTTKDDGWVDLSGLKPSPGSMAN